MRNYLLGKIFYVIITWIKCKANKVGLTTVHKIADYVLCRADENGKRLSPLELQKFVYYSQAWHLAIYEEALFDEHIEAWIHGPVQPDLWQRYRSYGWKDIDEIPSCPSLPNKVKEIVDEIIEVYGKMNVRELEKLAHSEDPWIDARGNIPIDRPSHAIISHESMKKYYSR